MIVDNWKYRNPKILKHAKGQNCQMRLPGICNHDSETVVAAHSNSMDDGKGLGTKAMDCFVVFLCSSCHDVYDNRKPVLGMSRRDIEDAFYRGMRKTWLILLKDGVLK